MIHRVALLENQKGYALVFAFILVAATSLIIIGLLMWEARARRAVLGYQHELQAYYNAESGLAVLMDSLRATPDIEWVNREVILPWGDVSQITSRRWGGYDVVVAHGVSGEMNVALHVLVGQTAGKLAGSAITVYNRNSPVTITGDCEIHGSISTSGWIRTQPFQGAPFTGIFADSVVVNEALSFPEISNRLERAMERELAYLDNPLQPFMYFEQMSVLSSLDTDDCRRIYSDEDIVMDEAWNHLPERVEVYSAGSIILDGEFQFPTMSKFVARDSISLQDGVSGEYGLFVANVITIGDSVCCNGQFLANSTIELSDAATLDYPSVLYLSRNAGQDTQGQIVLNGDTRVNGSVVAAREQGATPMYPQILIDDSAKAQGLVLNAGTTENRGTVTGSLATRRTYFYRSPSHYIDWIRTGVYSSADSTAVINTPAIFADERCWRIAEIIGVEYGAE